MKINKIILTLLLITIILGFISFIITKAKNNTINKTIIVYDTFYDRTVIDCTRINIIKRDSIIYNIKYETEKKIEKAIAANDSNTVILFQDLLSK